MNSRPWPTQLTPEQAERYYSQVTKLGPDDCRPWTGSCREKYYGKIAIGGRRCPATWIALLLSGRPRPSDTHLACHTCDNPCCVNPTHLWWGSKSDNAVDSAKKQRHVQTSKTHCRHGHPLSGDNLKISNRGWRICVTCQWNQRPNRRQEANQ